VRLRQKHTLVLDASHARKLLKQSSRFRPKETGGILLGYRYQRDRVAQLVELVGAGPGARRESHRFVPDGAWQLKQVADCYEQSGRTLEYLGDWHSHPNDIGPSGLDGATARKIAKSPAARCPHPIFLIATYVEEQWELRAYRYSARRLRRIEVRSAPARMS
jgi:integrative and conjugative element protein (TIGR02256 family)